MDGRERNESMNVYEELYESWLNELHENDLAGGPEYRENREEIDRRYWTAVEKGIKEDKTGEAFIRYYIYHELSEYDHNFYNSLDDDGGKSVEEFYYDRLNDVMDDFSVNFDMPLEEIRENRAIAHGLELAAEEKVSDMEAGYCG